MIMEAFWTWDKQGGLESDGDPIRGVDRCTDFDKGLWLEYGKHMWRKHQSLFQYHVKYIHKYIVKHFRVVILQYTKSPRDAKSCQFLAFTFKERRNFISGILVSLRQRVSRGKNTSCS